MAPARTILDVLNEFDGGTRMTPERALRATMRTLNKFAEEVNGFWDEWSLANEHELLTAHTGARFDGIIEGKPANQMLLAGLLYYPRAITDDPLSDFVNTDKKLLTALPKGPSGVHPSVLWPDATEYGGGAISWWDTDIAANERRQSLGRILRSYEPVRPLIETGVLIPIPTWKVVRQRQQLIAEAMRRDVEDPELYEVIQSELLSTNPFVQTRLDGVESPGLNSSQVREVMTFAPSFYFNKLVSVANEYGARYVPRLGGDHELLKLRLNQVANRPTSPIETRIIPDLASLKIPALSNVQAETLVKIRENEEAFEDFRHELNEIFSIAVGLPQDAEGDAVSSYIHDHLSRRVAEVERITRESKSFTRGFRLGFNEFLFGLAGSATSLGISGGISAQNLPTVAAGTVAGALVPGVATMLQTMFARPEISGSKLVILGLIERAAPVRVE